MLPREIGQPWYEIDDFWDSKLWEIEPHCQFAGLGGEDTMILSGGYGAPIHWKSFEPVNMLMRNTVKRWIAKAALRSTPLWLITGVIMLAVTGSKGGGYALAFRTWAAQPWLFGFEGYMEIGEIERMIFGINLGRLKWSPYSSDLSLHYQDQNGECVGQYPTRRPSPAEFVSTAFNSEYGELTLFTLIDTSTFTVALFRAVHSPVALLLCGSEGGMQRALLCSYDWETQTLYRETVLRVETITLEHMSRVDQFRLGLKRPMEETLEVDCV
ncbi:uncharacterized protein N7483_004822 [Penicillium malachiteum]|uniref:uncharacterized protein n=1 Tax=Penicillium malachiteum TaxID=1324776 RepID=UPI0025476DBE|nr:uncharacterized protein N7483_004822 [Penicillium malachiteum]KAJ5730314.1 hypothetical protein N7483_004822 [Penicillium malachiteum]